MLYIIMEHITIMFLTATGTPMILDMTDKLSSKFYHTPKVLAISAWTAPRAHVHVNSLRYCRN